MKIKLGSPLSVSIVIAVGLIVLLGYFLDIELLTNLRKIFLQWGVILAAIALYVGVINLINVHWRKIVTKQKGAAYSFILLLSLVFTLILVGYYGPTSAWSLWIFNYVQVPIEGSLMAVLAVALVYACVRLFKREIDLFSLVFMVTTLVVLLAFSPLRSVEIPGLHGPNGLSAFISRVPAIAGVRGILLGITLGTIATGLRVLLGADRPYNG